MLFLNSAEIAHLMLRIARDGPDGPLSARALHVVISASSFLPAQATRYARWLAERGALTLGNRPSLLPSWNP